MPTPLGHPIRKTEQTRIKTLTNQHGALGAARILGISPVTAFRAMAGLGLYPGTRSLIRERLAGLEANGSQCGAGNRSTARPNEPPARNTRSSRTDRAGS